MVLPNLCALRQPCYRSEYGNWHILPRIVLAPSQRVGAPAQRVRPRAVNRRRDWLYPVFAAVRARAHANLAALHADESARDRGCADSHSRCLVRHARLIAALARPDTPPPSLSRLRARTGGHALHACARFRPMRRLRHCRHGEYARSREGDLDFRDAEIRGPSADRGRVLGSALIRRPGSACALSQPAG